MKIENAQLGAVLLFKMALMVGLFQFRTLTRLLPYFLTYFHQGYFSTRAIIALASTSILMLALNKLKSKPLQTFKEAILAHSYNKEKNDKLFIDYFSPNLYWAFSLGFPRA